MKRVVSHELLMPQGSHFSCFAKKSNQKKATPDNRPDPRFEAKTSRGPKLASAQTTDRFIDVFTPNLGGEYTGAQSNRYLITARSSLRQVGERHLARQLSDRLFSRTQSAKMVNVPIQKSSTYAATNSAATARTRVR